MVRIVWFISQAHGANFGGILHLAFTKRLITSVIKTADNATTNKKNLTCFLSRIQKTPVEQYPCTTGYCARNQESVQLLCLNKVRWCFESNRCLNKECAFDFKNACYSLVHLIMILSFGGETTITRVKRFKHFVCLRTRKQANFCQCLLVNKLKDMV